MFCLRQGWGQANPSPDLPLKDILWEASSEHGHSINNPHPCFPPALTTGQTDWSALMAKVAPTSRSAMTHPLQELRLQAIWSPVLLDHSGTHTSGMPPPRLCWQKLVVWRTIRKAVFQGTSKPFVQSSSLSCFKTRDVSKALLQTFQHGKWHGSQQAALSLRTLQPTWGQHLPTCKHKLYSQKNKASRNGQHTGGKKVVLRNYFCGYFKSKTTGQNHQQRSEQTKQTTVSITQERRLPVPCRFHHVCIPDFPVELILFRYWLRLGRCSPFFAVNAFLPCGWVHLSAIEALLLNNKIQRKQEGVWGAVCLVVYLWGENKRYIGAILGGGVTGCNKPSLPCLLPRGKCFFPIIASVWTYRTS